MREYFRAFNSMICHYRKKIIVRLSRDFSSEIFFKFLEFIETPSNKLYSIGWNTGSPPIRY